MWEENRLGALQMGVARHHHIDMLFREVEQGALQRAKARNDLDNLRAYVKAQIERDLIVATARGVELGASRTDSFRQGRFDIHVHVFEGRVPLKFSSVDFFL